MTNYFVDDNVFDNENRVIIQKLGAVCWLDKLNKINAVRCRRFRW
jgi:hypothetical protein